MRTEQEFTIEIIDEVVSLLIELSELGICQNEISKLSETLIKEKSKLENK